MNRDQCIPLSSPFPVLDVYGANTALEHQPYAPSMFSIPFPQVPSIKLEQKARSEQLFRESVFKHNAGIE